MSNTESDSHIRKLDSEKNPVKSDKVSSEFQFENDIQAMQWLGYHNFKPELRIVKCRDEEGNLADIPAYGIDLTFVIFGKDINKIGSRVKRLCSLLAKVDREFLEDNNMKHIIDDAKQ